MRDWLRVTLFCLSIILLPVSSINADPGLGIFTGGSCRASGMDATRHTCTYTFTTTVDSELIVLKAGYGPWTITFDPDDNTDGTSVATVQIRRVVGDSDLTNESTILNDLTLTGGTGAHTIFLVPSGRYWIDVITADAGDNSFVRIERS